MKQSANSICSLSGAEWSPDFEEICDVASLIFGVQLEVVLNALLTLGLDVEVLEIIPVDGLSLILIECFSLLSNEFLETFLRVSHSLLVVLGVHDAQHLVVVGIEVELHWMLVVGEK